MDLSVAFPASWLPLVPGLTPHGQRHTHKVWMDEDDGPDVLQRQRLGHDGKEREERSRSATRGYQHVSDGMRASFASRSSSGGRWR